MLYHISCVEFPKECISDVCSLFPNAVLVAQGCLCVSKTMGNCTYSNAANLKV
jgi:hypothetical protein